jgi:hypothetical protein
MVILRLQPSAEQNVQLKLLMKDHSACLSIKLSNATILLSYRHDVLSTIIDQVYCITFLYLTCCCDDSAFTMFNMCDVSIYMRSAYGFKMYMHAAFMNNY